MAPRSGDGEGDLAGGTRRKPGATSRARAMRREGTKPEALLWIELKARRLGGFHFVRQLPIGPYFVDFACRKGKLVIELDGSQHADSSHDRRRDAFLQARGWSTLRFWNDDVIHHRGAVCETILAVLHGRLAESVDVAELRFVLANAKRSPSA